MLVNIRILFMIIDVKVREGVRVKCNGGVGNWKK